MFLLANTMMLCQYCAFLEVVFERSGMWGKMRQMTADIFPKFPKFRVFPLQKQD